MHLNICIIQQTNSKQQTETNQQSTIVTQQGAYAYPVPIGNPRFRAESRLRKNEEEEEEEEEVFQEREGGAQFSTLRRSRMRTWKPRTP